jgi:type VI secretion system secreted protein Hcp
MAIDAFLVFTTSGGQPTLEGETQDKEFSAKHAVEVLWFSLGIHHTIAVGAASSGGEAGKAQLNAFKITKLVDRASPTLLLYAGNGSHIAQLDLYLRKSGGPSGKGKGLVFLQYSFKLVFVSDIEWNGDSGKDAVREDVTFTYGALQVKYVSQAPNGQAGTTFTGAWNRVKNNSSFVVPGVG